MALNTSGPISIAGTTAGQSIQIELGGTGSTQMGLNCASVRTLAGVPTGAIVMPTCFYGKSNTVPFGCATYTAAGSYTFTVPSGVSKISVVCVGAGTSGNRGTDRGALGGKGGGLSFSNCIPTTPGESLSVVVGAAAPNSGGGGGSSSIARGGTFLVRAVTNPSNSACGTGSVKYCGGSGGARDSNGGGGGGGAAGYAGNGGRGRGTAPVPALPGSGGGGGGGGTGAACGGSGGGGVGLIVQGSNGAAGTVNTGGGGGSGGGNGTSSSGSTNGQPGGAYGGGGGGSRQSCPYSLYPGGDGAVGGVRIIYGGTGKSYPSNSAP